MAAEPESRNSRRARCGGISVLLAAVLVTVELSQNAYCQEEPLPGEAAASAQAANPDSGGSQTDDEKRSEIRQQSALAGLLVLALLCVVFLTLMICVVLWARRMRRLTSQPLPDQHPGDALWYLRKPVAKMDDGGIDD